VLHKSAPLLRRDATAHGPIGPNRCDAARPATPIASNALPTALPAATTAPRSASRA
jgi:hypothetical protein